MQVLCTLWLFLWSEDCCMETLPCNFSELVCNDTRAVPVKNRTETINFFLSSDKILIEEMAVNSFLPIPAL